MSIIFRDQYKFIIRRRITSTLLRAAPASLEHFDAHLYAVVPRAIGREQPGIYGADVRLDPCVLDWDSKTITIRIPADINPGVEGIEDLDPDFFEAIQAAFLTLMCHCTV